MTGNNGIACLTKREQDTLALYCAGYNGNGIARKLTVSCSTVKSHVHSIKFKLGAKSLEELTDIAATLGLHIQPCFGEWKQLTRREMEILGYFASGYHCAEIATTLGIKPRTVKTTIGNAYVKLGLSACNDCETPPETYQNCKQINAAIALYLAHEIRAK